MARQLRRAILTFLFVVVVLGHLVSALTYREAWPFSPYPMYANKLKVPFENSNLYVVTPSSEEFQLLGWSYFDPLNAQGVTASLDKLNRRNQDNVHDSASSEITAAMEDLLRRYELGRVNGKHDGPQAIGLRFYRETWQIETPGTDPRPPLARRLISEVLGDSGE